MSAAENTSSQFGRYELRYLVARGGMASVYLAQLPGPQGFEKWVALKIIHPHLAANKRFARMFLDEARVAAKISHPNVCSVIDFGADDDRKLPFQVMEYLHGETFAAVLRRGEKRKSPFPRHLAVRVVAEAARGLHAAHELKKPNGEPLGLVHRDISPQNIFVLYDGNAKVLDFGVAQLRDRTGETKSGELKGKIGYMSPEQFQNEKLDRRSDVWALGVVLWESTVGKTLFEGMSHGATVYAVVQEEIPKPADIVEGYPEELQAIVLRALEKDREKRYQTTAELAADLERYLHHLEEPIGPDKVGAWMNKQFADRKKARSKLLRNEKLSDAEIPELDLGSGDHSSVSPLDTPPLTPAGPRKRSASLLIIGAALIIALFVGALWLAGGRDDGESGDPSSSEPVSAALRPTNERAGALSDDAAQNGTGSADAQATPRMEDAAPLRVQRDRDAAIAPSKTPDSGLSPTDTAAVDAASSSVATPSKSQNDERQQPRDEHKRLGPPGRLSLLAIPAAEVYRRGRKIGRTPLFNHELPPGVHRLTLRPVGGGQKRTITIRIRSGQSVRRSVRLGSE